MVYSHRKLIILRLYRRPVNAMVIFTCKLLSYDHSDCSFEIVDHILLQNCFLLNKELRDIYFRNIFASEVFSWTHITYFKTSCDKNAAVYQDGITLTSLWLQWRLKSPASRLFTQPFIQTQIKENIKAPRHWPLCVEFTGTGEFPTQRAIYAENVSIWWRQNTLHSIDTLMPQQSHLHNI